MGKSKTTWRLFVALEIPDTVRQYLEGIQANLRRAGTPVKWVRPEGIHLTLKFLGDVASHRAEELTRALEKAVTGCAPFQLQPAEVGAFPSVRNPRVIWVGLEGESAALNGLHKGVERAMRKRGFPGERRPFTPHLTLGRVRRDATRSDLEALGRAMVDLDAEVCAPWDVASLALIRSQLFPDGARYTILSRIPLRGS